MLLRGDGNVKKYIISFVGNTLSTRLGESLSSSYLLEMSEEELNQKSPEINSLNQIIRHEATGDVTFDIYLLSTETEEVYKCAEVLREFYLDKRRVSKMIPYSLVENVEVKIIKGLDAKKQGSFSEGVRNLLVDFSEIVNGFSFERNYSNYIVNSTPGYKSINFFVSLLAQMLRMPTYYIYEPSTRYDKPELISMPLLPVKFDFSIFDDNLELFLALDDPNTTVDISKLKSVESSHSFDAFFEKTGNNWKMTFFVLVLWEIYKSRYEGFVFLHKKGIELGLKQKREQFDRVLREFLTRLHKNKEDPDLNHNVGLPSPWHVFKTEVDNIEVRLLYTFEEYYDHFGMQSFRIYARQVLFSREAHNAGSEYVDIFKRTISTDTAFDKDMYELYKVEKE